MKKKKMETIGYCPNCKTPLTNRHKCNFCDWTLDRKLGYFFLED